MALSYDEALKRFSESRREVIEEGVRFLEPTIEGRLAFEAEWRAFEGSEADRIVAAIAACAVDDDGRPLFDSPERKAALRSEASGQLVQKCFAAALDLLTIKKEEVDRAVGECEGDQISEDSSASPSASVSPTRSAS